MSTGRLYLDMNTLRIVTKRVPVVRDTEGQRQRRNALARARRLAELHGVTIEADTQERGAYWVTHPDLDDTPADPCGGSHFCKGGDEVLQAVEAYARHFAKAPGSQS